MIATCSLSLRFMSSNGLIRSTRNNKDFNRKSLLASIVIAQISTSEWGPWLIWVWRCSRILNLFHPIFCKEISFVWLLEQLSTAIWTSHIIPTMQNTKWCPVGPDTRFLPFSWWKLLIWIFYPITFEYSIYWDVAVDVSQDNPNFDHLGDKTLKWTRPTYPQQMLMCSTSPAETKRGNVSIKKVVDTSLKNSSSSMLLKVLVLLVFVFPSSSQSASQVSFTFTSLLMFPSHDSWWWSWRDGDEVFVIATFTYACVIMSNRTSFTMTPFDIYLFLDGEGSFVVIFIETSS